MAGIVAGLQVGKVPPVLPILRNELRIDFITAGWVASLFNACSAVLGVMTGLFADRLGARPIIHSCMALLALGSMIGGIATSVTILFLGRLIEGVGFVGIVVSAPVIITAASKPEDRALTLSIWGIYMPVGMAAAMALTPFLLECIGWRGIWLVNVVVIVVTSLAFGWTTAPHRWPDPTFSDSRQRSWHDVRQTLSLVGPWVLGVCFTLYSIQYFAVITWLPTFLMDSLGKTAENSALISAAVVFVNIFGNLSVVWLLQQGCERWHLIAAAYVVMAIAAVGIFSQNIANILKVTLAFIFSMFGGLLPATIFASAPRHAPSAEQVATTNGIIVQCSNCGTLVGPPIMAVTVGILGGWQNAYCLMLTCSVVGLGFAMWLRKIEYSN